MKPSEETAKDCWNRLEKRLGYSFRDRTLLKEALTHRSFANECQREELPDNERLEFLGDAVLDLIVSQYLMTALPDSAEGDMTRIRAEVVQAPSLARLARKLDVGSALLLGKGEERSGGRDKPSLLADAMEALLGAIFTDSGFESVQSVVLPHFVPLLEQALLDEGQDYKSRLQEMLQARQGKPPVYRTVETSGPAHDRTYLIDVLIDGRARGTGRGRTKKRAEQAAAKAALAGLGEMT